jgi:hypothetical protein
MELFDEAYHSREVPLLRGRHHGSASIVRTSIDVCAELINEASHLIETPLLRCKV